MRKCEDCNCTQIETEYTHMYDIRALDTLLQQLHMYQMQTENIVPQFLLSITIKKILYDIQSMEETRVKTVP